MRRVLFSKYVLEKTEINFQTFRFLMAVSLLFSCPFSENVYVLFAFGATAPQWARATSFTRFLDE